MTKQKEECRCPAEYIKQHQEEGWGKALWMIEQGFTTKQLRSMYPSDADAWSRIRRFVTVVEEGETLALPEKKDEWESNKFYIAYQCTHSSETRGKTKQDRTEPCGKWNIIKSRKRPTEMTSHQARCPDCGKRSNLSKKNTYTFKKPEQAHDFIVNKLRRMSA